MTDTARSGFRVGSVMLFTAIVLIVALLAQRVWQSSKLAEETEKHKLVPYPRALVSLDGDRYGLEAVFTEDGYVTLYIVDGGTRQLREVVAQRLTAHVRAVHHQQGSAVELRPAPQRGDTTGTTSCFKGALPPQLVGQPLCVTIPNLRIGEKRFHVALDQQPLESMDMPVPVGPTAERELHLTPDGKYTFSDIQANGRTIPSMKYRGFQARHDFDPQPGDRICPVTRTKANPSCVWVIGGDEYAFCCPPCIDEFVRVAKSRPETIEPPHTYIEQ